MTTHLPIYEHDVCYGVSTDVDKAVGGLIKSLSARAEDGWVAVGDITHIDTNGTHIFIQAIVKLTEVTA